MDYNILIAPYGKALRPEYKCNNDNPKNYPHEFWEELLVYLGGDGIFPTQIMDAWHKELPGIINTAKGKSLREIEQMVRECDLWVSVDTYLQHLAYSIDKPGIVLWSITDPLIYGHAENVNLLKSRKYLSKNQSWLMEQLKYEPNAFLSARYVYNKIRTNLG